MSLSTSLVVPRRAAVPVLAEPATPHPRWLLRPQQLSLPSFFLLFEAKKFNIEIKVYCMNIGPQYASSKCPELWDQLNWGILWQDWNPFFHFEMQFAMHWGEFALTKEWSRHRYRWGKSPEQRGGHWKFKPWRWHGQKGARLRCQMLLQKGSKVIAMII